MFKILLLVMIMVTNFSQVVKASDNITTNINICSAQKLQEILQPASKQHPSVYVDCSLTLPDKSKISKQLIFAGEQASNIVFDCNGAEINATYAKPSILITSKRQQASQHQEEQWLVPHHIVIKNGKIVGSLRIHGMAANGEGELLKASSHQAGHTKRAQQAAPHHIVLDKLTLMARQHNMLYIAPGVHHITLKNSQFMGPTDGLALYLDAETSHNVIENNIFNVHTKTREVIAVDGSAYNIIRHNRFVHPQHGAIYLYRNCGEGGTVRHQTSAHNQIIQNQFELSLTGKLPLIWLASRNGHRNYCDEDSGYVFGSSINDKDLATHNIVSQNFFNFKKLPKLYQWTMNIKERLIRMNAQPNQVSSNQVHD